jgi:transposase
MERGKRKDTGPPLSADERARRLARVRAMLATGCRAPQVSERFGIGIEHARHLIREARQATASTEGR